MPDIRIPKRTVTAPYWLLNEYFLLIDGSNAVVGNLPYPMAKAPSEMTWLSDASIRVKAGSFRSEDDASNISLASDIDITGLSTAMGASAHHYVLAGLDGNGDAAATTSTANALPTGWQSYRCIGSIFTNASSNVYQFHQFGDIFEFDSPIQMFNGTGTGSYANLTVPMPPDANGRFVMNANGGSNYQLALLPTFCNPSSLSVTAWNMMAGLGPSYDGGEYSAMVDSSRQVKHASNTGTAYRIYAMGYVDRRGRDL